MELIKLADQATIRSYFYKIKELQNSGEEYPVDLDDIWTLCYSEKSKAVRALTLNFIENVDFNLACPKWQASHGGVNKKVYRLTTACMEHFIARKVKEVFEVYRQVFHMATSQPQRLPTNKELAQWFIEAENAKEAAQKQLAVQKPMYDYATEVLKSPTHMTVNQIAMDLGMSATKLNRALRDMDIQYYQNGRWVLCAAYRSLGYAKNRTDIKNGHAIHYLVWSERGRAFIHSKLNPLMVDSIRQKHEFLNQRSLN